MGNIAVESCCGGEKRPTPALLGSTLTTQTAISRPDYSTATKPPYSSSPKDGFFSERYMSPDINSLVQSQKKILSPAVPSEPPTKKQLDLNSFELIKVIGRGSFGKVFLARHKKTSEIMALKKMKKKEMADRLQLDNILTEKKILQKSDHPFIVKLMYAFQNEGNIYLGMEYLPGGELFFHLRNSRRFGEAAALFYASEVLLALEYLHKDLKVIYRDLKPENVLLDSDGHIKITDFGLSKYYQFDTLSKSFCGTPEYFAPEVVLGNGYGPAVDMWSFGCFLYEIMVGKPPFQADNRSRLFKLIIDGKIHYPERMSPTAKDLISKLLTPNPDERLGMKNIQEIKNHPFFASVDWKKVLKKEVPPPFKPVVRSTTDVRNFDTDYTAEIAKETPAIAAHYKVADFSYIRRDQLGENSPVNGA